MTKEDLAAIGREMLMVWLNVPTFRDVIREVQNRRIAQPFVKKSRENYHEAIGMALALYYAAQTQKDPIAALKGLVPDTEYRVRKNTSAAQLAARSVIHYGSTDAQRRANRQFAS